MYGPGDREERPEEAALEDLERAVADAVERLRDLQERVEAAETRSAQLQQLVGRFTGDAKGASDLLTRLGHLDDENADLRERLDRGRAAVERLLARIRFLEDQR
ncbi:MAG: hypothetical protein U5R14_06710 [Gemmatimonadota bacterium]|nr:hypothetical protein [Gemmatimonadota bacterium]